MGQKPLCLRRVRRLFRRKRYRQFAVPTRAAFPKLAERLRFVDAGNVWENEEVWMAKVLFALSPRARHHNGCMLFKSGSFLASSRKLPSIWKLVSKCRRASFA